MGLAIGVGVGAHLAHFTPLHFNRSIEFGSFASDDLGLTHHFECPPVISWTFGLGLGDPALRSDYFLVERLTVL
jgi:hypothetical protein